MYLSQSFQRDAFSRCYFAYSSVAEHVITTLSPEREWQVVVKSLRDAALGYDTLKLRGAGSGVKWSIKCDESLITFGLAVSKVV